MEVTTQERKALRAVKLSLLRVVHSQVDEAAHKGIVWGMSEGHGPDTPYSIEGVAERIMCKVRKVTATAYKKYMDKTYSKGIDMSDLIDGCGNIIEPRGKNAWADILKRPDFKEWEKARQKEQDKIKLKEVFTKPMTRKERLAMGIQDIKAVPVNEIWEIKKTPDQELDKFKCRMVLVGCPWNMPEGTYGKTFSATPLMATTRILLFVLVQLGWIHETGDVSNAYLEAWMDLRWRVPVSMPADLKTFFTHPDGRVEELHPVMQKGLYGHPGSGRAWAKVRDKLLTGPMFNWEGSKPPSGVEGVKLPAALARGNGHKVKWQSKKARYDPTAFIFAYTDQEERVWRGMMVTYVDDIDVAFERHIDIVHVGDH